MAVNITANTEKFTKGLAKAKDGIGKFVGSISAAQVAAVGFAGYALASITTAAIEAGGALYEMTQKLHISAEALSTLHYAADQLESSSAAVDAALAFMTKNLGKAAQGAEPAIEAFNRLNINFEKLQGLSVDQQFMTIVDALNKIKDPAERAAAAQGIFGKGAKELSALIEAGTASIVEMGNQAAATGAIISTDTAAALDEAGDAIKAFSDSWAALKLQMVGAFAPALTWTMNAISEAMKFGRAAWYAFEVVVSAGLESILVAMQKALQLWNILAPSFAEVDLEGAASAVDSMAGVSKGYLEKMRGVYEPGDNPLARSAANVSGHVTTQAEEKAQAKVESEAAKKQAKDKKEEEKQIAAAAKKQNAQLDQLISQGSKRGPVIQVVGVR